MSVRLLLASDNAKKRAELEAMLAGSGVELVLPSEVGGLPEVDEDQPDFEGNARKKARSAAQARGLWSLADDSGLEVESLDGAPGVRSARFAGTHGDDAGNNALLLERLAGLEPDARGARFVCALCLVRPDGEVAFETRGEVRGRILEEARGVGGFGYDPLFLFTEEGFEETGLAFAELSAPQKARVSHRGRALAQLVEVIPKILAS